MGQIRNLLVFLGLILFTVAVLDCRVTADVIPSENECRPYIEKAIHELKNVEPTGSEDDNESIEDNLSENLDIENAEKPEIGNDEGDNETVEDGGEDSAEPGNIDDNYSEDDVSSQENQNEENVSREEAAQDNTTVEDSNDGNESNQQDNSKEETTDDKDGDNTNSEEEKAADDKGVLENITNEGESGSEESSNKQNDYARDVNDDGDNSKENTAEDETDSKQDSNENIDDDLVNDSAQKNNQDEEAPGETESEESNDGSNEESMEIPLKESTDENEDVENKSSDESENQTEETADESFTESGSANETEDNSQETLSEGDTNEDVNDESAEEIGRTRRNIADESNEASVDSTQDDHNESQEIENEVSNEIDIKENSTDSEVQSKESVLESGENSNSGEIAQSEEENEDEGKSAEEDNEEDGEKESMPEEDLTMEFEIPKNLRSRIHVSDLLGLDEESSIKENALKRTGDVVLKELKRVFDNAIKPLESMYKYRDLSNRHFGDPEIFSKPLVLFMGPWSGGKSTILNYLTENEYTPNSIRSGAEPSPAYFNILMHGDKPEVLDGTQLAADWTFSGLQKFGQGLMDRLRGQKLPNKLLERVNIVEIPGILEVRKQVSKYFPFNDACQWFIDRADIIFLVYDPSKLDVGPETEAILDQLKGREYQTKILLNKADQVKPEELLRVQGALIWNISPLMSSAQPPVMYTVSLWSHPFENGAPIRLLQAQERAFLTDLREAIDKRIENKIASARRFAVRIRNHAKMVDCYLTTYYNQKGLFSNKKQVADKIIEHPQNYNIYEGLSTLTNISRYDLPDPEVYMDFFRLNPLYEFKKLSETCTYFKGCPINKLDIAIAYELPELVGKYKKLFEQNLVQTRKEYDENCNQTESETPVKIIKSR